MSSLSPSFDVVTITLNPAIDRTVTIPHFTAGIVNRVETVRSNPGGKGVNVAAALAEYGYRVAVTGFLGRENTASFEALFQKKSIKDHFIRIAGQTRVGIKISDPEQHQTTDINFPGPAPEAADLTKLAEQIADLDASWFVLAGSLPTGVEPTIYHDLILRLKERGKHVALDASGLSLPLALKAKPSLFKPNIHELSELLDRPLDSETAIIQAARTLITGGIDQVVVSMGEKGACFVTAHEVVIARPPPVEVLSTVGAGDAMVAGIISAHLQGLPLDQCARHSTAFSVHALTHTTDDSDFTASVNSFQDQVQIIRPELPRI